MSLRWDKSLEKVEDTKDSPNINETGCWSNSSLGPYPNSDKKTWLTNRILPSGDDAQHTANGEIFKKTWDKQTKIRQSQRVKCEDEKEMRKDSNIWRFGNAVDEASSIHFSLDRAWWISTLLTGSVVSLCCCVQHCSLWSSPFLSPSLLLFLLLSSFLSSFLALFSFFFFSSLTLLLIFWLWFALPSAIGSLLLVLWCNFSALKILSFLPCFLCPVRVSFSFRFYMFAYARAFLSLWFSSPFLSSPASSSCHFLLKQDAAKSVHHACVVSTSLAFLFSLSLLQVTGMRCNQEKFWDLLAVTVPDRSCFLCSFGSRPHSSNFFQWHNTWCLSLTRPSLGLLCFAGFSASLFCSRFQFGEWSELLVNPRTTLCACIRNFGMDWLWLLVCCSIELDGSSLCDWHHSISRFDTLLWLLFMFTFCRTHWLSPLDATERIRLVALHPSNHMKLVTRTRTSTCVFYSFSVCYQQQSNIFLFVLFLFCILCVVSALLKCVYCWYLCSVSFFLLCFGTHLSCVLLINGKDWCFSVCAGDPTRVSCLFIL